MALASGFDLHILRHVSDQWPWQSTEANTEKCSIVLDLSSKNYAR